MADQRNFGKKRGEIYLNKGVNLKAGLDSHGQETQSLIIGGGIPILEMEDSS